MLLAITENSYQKGRITLFILSINKKNKSMICPFLILAVVALIMMFLKKSNIGALVYSLIFVIVGAFCINGSLTANLIFGAVCLIYASGYERPQHEREGASVDNIMALAMFSLVVANLVINYWWGCGYPEVSGIIIAIVGAVAIWANKEVK